MTIQDRNGNVMPYDVWIARQRRAYLLELLAHANGNQCRAAELCGVHRNTIGRLIGEANISRSDIRRVRLSHLRNGANNHV